LRACGGSRVCKPPRDPDLVQGNCALIGCPHQLCCAAQCSADLCCAVRCCAVQCCSLQCSCALLWYARLGCAVQLWRRLRNKNSITINPPPLPSCRCAPFALAPVPCCLPFLPPSSPHLNPPPISYRCCVAPVLGVLSQTTRRPSSHNANLGPQLPAEGLRALPAQGFMWRRYGRLSARHAQQAPGQTPASQAARSVFQVLLPRLGTCCAGPVVRACTKALPARRCVAPVLESRPRQHEDSARAMRTWDRSCQWRVCVRCLPDGLNGADRAGLVLGMRRWLGAIRRQRQLHAPQPRRLRRGGEMVCRPSPPGLLAPAGSAMCTRCDEGFVATPRQAHDVCLR
jgi:hypothetical protein